MLCLLSFLFFCFLLTPSLLLSWMFEQDCLDTRCLGCLKSTCFVFLYLHLFSAIEHVSQSHQYLGNINQPHSDGEPMPSALWKQRPTNRDGEPMISSPWKQPTSQRWRADDILTLETTNLTAMESRCHAHLGDNQPHSDGEPMPSSPWRQPTSQRWRADAIITLNVTAQQLRTQSISVQR